MIVQGLSDLAHSHGLVESLNAVSAEVLREEGNANEGELGRYLCFSGEPERALEPLGNAVSGAVRRREIAMARQWVELLAHAMTLADVALDEPRWGQLWIDQADIWIELGRIPEAEVCIDRVLAKADTRGWTRLVLKAGRRKADLLRWANRSEQAAQRYEEVKAKLENIEQGLEYYRCLYGLGVLYRRRGALLNAERALTAAIRYCQQQSPSALMVYSVLALGGVLRTGSRLKEAQACFVEAHRLAIQLGIPAVAVDCHIGLGELARLTGGLDEAEGYYQSALDLSPPWVSHRWAFAEMNMCMVLLARGRWDEANFRLHRVCACAGPLNMPMLETMGKLLATPIQIGDLNDTEWTAYVKDVEQALRTTGMFDPDLGWVFALAATRAKWMGHNSRCLKMLELAAAQWKALGRTQEESAVLARIKDLENAGPG